MAQLYSWLIAHYEPGDCLYLFGFSRGAFTVRALAGLLHVCGLPRRDDAHLAPFALGLYHSSESRIARTRAAQRLPPKFEACESTDHARFDGDVAAFKALAGQDLRVAFLGIWDTVKAYGWLNPQSFPAMRHNPAVDVVRHAAPVHEYRALFKIVW